MKRVNIPNSLKSFIINCIGYCWYSFHEYVQGFGYYSEWKVASPAKVAVTIGIGSSISKINSIPAILQREILLYNIY